MLSVQASPVLGFAGTCSWDMTLRFLVEAGFIIQGSSSPASFSSDWWWLCLQRSSVTGLGWPFRLFSSCTYCHGWACTFLNKVLRSVRLRSVIMCGSSRMACWSPRIYGKSRANHLNQFPLRVQPYEPRIKQMTLSHHALQRTAADGRGCHRRVSWPPT